MVDHVKMLTIYERTPTARQLGERLGLTNVERQRLKLWPFKPIDAADEELIEQRKARRNARRKAKRARTRFQYLSSCLTATKPWETEGICRRTWERRRVASVGQTIVSRSETIPATASVVEAQRGRASARCKEPTDRGEVVMLSEAMKAKDVKRIAFMHLWS